MAQQKQQQKLEFEYDMESVFNAIKHLSAVSIKGTEKGIEIFGFDCSRGMMTEVSIDKKDLKNFKIDKEMEVVTETEYLNILKRFYVVKAYIDEQKMVFSEDKTTAQLPVIDRKLEKPNLDIKREVSFELSAYDVRKALKDIETIDSDSFELQFKGKEAIFTAEGTRGKITKILEVAEKGIQKFQKAKDSIKVCLSLEFFRNALNGSGRSDNKMRITLAEKSPVIVEYLPNDYGSKEKVTHYIAPLYTGEDLGEDNDEDIIEDTEGEDEDSDTE